MDRVIGAILQTSVNEFRNVVPSFVQDHPQESASASCDMVLHTLCHRPAGIFRGHDQNHTIHLVDNRKWGQIFILDKLRWPPL